MSRKMRRILLSITTIFVILIFGLYVMLFEILPNSYATAEEAISEGITMNSLTLKEGGILLEEDVDKYKVIIYSNMNSYLSYCILKNTVFGWRVFEVGSGDYKINSASDSSRFVSSSLSSKASFIFGTVNHNEISRVLVNDKEARFFSVNDHHRLWYYFEQNGVKKYTIKALDKDNHVIEHHSK